MLWELSYANMTMLLATIPSYEDKKKKETEDKEIDGFAEMADVFK